ncbi:Prefoldin [Kickxella alabastrina]|uniref:Prefoldin n=1 Tax=Kickxella alabastrina TaxID=61397 RepID=UPI00221F5E9A|nr:Prefoldin [Kickxella alabastrina]KAI7827219.1 Prefoldin [Kickxella alabastrina]KAJ1939093.1 hypothetical protein GGF37_004538 [Kickxella alabastrina]
MSDDNTAQQVYYRITQKLQDCQKQLGQIEAQISGNQRESRLAALTRREIEGLDASVPLYKSTGKMFIQEPKDDLLKEIDTTAENSKAMVEALEKKQKFVRREMEEASGNLKDIVRSIQTAAATTKA